MRVLLTGGAGFIGSHIAEGLVAEGVDVVVADVLLPAAQTMRPDIPEAVEFHLVDVRDEQRMRTLVSDVDAVCHQAARVGLGVSFQDVTEYVGVNALGTAVLLKALDDVGFAGRFVVAGSMVVYGEGAYRCSRHGMVRPHPRTERSLALGRFEPPCPECDLPLAPVAVTEDASLDPRNVYAATKVHQEQLCMIFGRERDVPVASLRYHNVYGARMPSNTPYAGVASIFRSAIERGDAPQVFEDGGQLRDFIHVSDIARANITCLLAEEPVDGAFNIATGKPRSVLDMATALSRALDGPEPQITGAFRLGDVRHVFASPAKAQRELGFSARVDFEDGMKSFAREPMREAEGAKGR